MVQVTLKQLGVTKEACWVYLNAVSFPLHSSHHQDERERKRGRRERGRRGASQTGTNRLEEKLTCGSVQQLTNIGGALTGKKQQEREHQQRERERGR